MKPPALQIHETKASSLILIVDRIGVIGEALSRELSQDSMVVLVTPGPMNENIEKIIHVPFKKRIPQIPDNRYSKIFIIDDGRAVTKQSASSFITKARESNSPLYFIGSIRNVDIKHAGELASSYSNAKILIFGDLFDKNIFFDKNESISKFILQARINEKILVEGNGLSLSFPITFKDTIKLIIKASYLEIPQKIILLFYQHPITDISLANIFQKINPNIVVDFTKENKKREIYMPDGAQHAISNYKLIDKIKELELEDSENRKIKLIKQELSGNKNFLKPLMFFILLILFIILLPFMTTSAYGILGEREIANARESAQAGNLAKARKNLDRSKTFFEIALKTSKPLIQEAGLVGREGDAYVIRQKIDSGKNVSIAGLHMLDGLDLIGGIYKGESRDEDTDFLLAATSFKSAISLFQKTKAEGNLSKKYIDEYDSFEPFIDVFSNSSDILPDVLGFENDKTYLVLIQDNSELRPGGGVVVATGELKIGKGKIISFNTKSAKELDAKIKTILESPFGIRRYMPLERLTLRDSNFNPDFVKNSITASNMYSLATNVKVDGVIGVDAIFVENLLSVVNSVDFDEGAGKITSDNFNEIWQKNADNDYLQTTINKIIEVLAKKEKKNYDLALMLGKSIKEKHLVIALPRQSYQNIFTANNWSSSLWDSRQKSPNTINDYNGLVEANLGKNKVNHFISRSISKKVSLSGKGILTSRLTVAYKNNSSTLDYKNYIQLILPEQSRVLSVVVDGKESNITKAITDSKIYSASNFKPPIGYEIEERNEMDKSVFGFLVNIPRSQVQTVSIVYELPMTIAPAKKSAMYSLKYFKQPGVNPFPFELSFDLPPDYHVISNTKTSVEIKSDKDFEFLISQK